MQFIFIIYSYNSGEMCTLTSEYNMAVYKQLHKTMQMSKTPTYSTVYLINAKNIFRVNCVRRIFPEYLSLSA